MPMSLRLLLNRTILRAGFALLLATTAPAYAQGEISAFQLYFELNSTDKDVGLHSLLDGDAWERARIVGPGVLVMRAQSDPAVTSADFGLTELFFESNEPPIGERSFADLLALYPPATYTATLFFIDGGDASEETALTADLPCPLALDEPKVKAKKKKLEVTLSWSLTPGVFDPDDETCDDSEDVDVALVEVVIDLENEETGETRIFRADVDPAVTAIEAPEEFLAGAADAGFDAKAEILVIEATGNRTSVELEFDLD